MMTHKELRMMVKQLSDYQVNQIAQVAMRYVALNQELADIKPDGCPYCGDVDAVLIRKGVQRGKQRFQCKSCGHKFTYDTKQLTSNSQQPLESWVVVLENTLALESLDATAKRIDVCHSTAKLRTTAVRSMPRIRLTTAEGLLAGSVQPNFSWVRWTIA